MTIKINLFTSFTSIFKEFFFYLGTENNYKIVNLYECQKSGFMRAVIQVSSRHIIEKNISDLITDNSLLENFDKKTIRTLTYMATIERMKPDYAVVVQQLQDEVDEYLLEIKSLNNKCTIKKTPTEITKDQALLSKFSPIDASRIGYLAGIVDTINDFKLKKNIQNDN